VTLSRPSRAPLFAVLVAAVAALGVTAAGVSPAAAGGSAVHRSAGHRASVGRTAGGSTPVGLKGDDAGVTERVFTAGPLVANFSKATRENFSSAAVGYLEGGSTPYVAAGYVDGTVHVWNALTGQQKFSVNTGPGSIEASIAMVNVDGHTDILGANEHGDVFMYNGAGRRVFHVRMAARTPGCTTCLRGGFATPTIAYLDANSTPFIVESGWDEHLWAWNARTGRVAPGFPVFLKDTSWSSPAIAYLTGSKYPDIIVGYDCGGARAQRCWPRQGGYVGAFNHLGQMLPGWPYFVDGETVWSSPAVVSLIPGHGEDVVVGTGLFPYPAHPNAGKEVIALNSRGRPLPGWPVPVDSKVFSSPAVGAVTSVGGEQDVAVNSQDGQVYLINAQGRRLWHTCVSPFSGGCAFAHSSPVIADVMGTALPQVIVDAGNTWHVFNAEGHEMLSGQIAGTAMGLSATPTVTEINGRAALFFTLLRKDGAARLREVVEYLLPKPLGDAPWPTFKQNMGRSGTTAPD
jgi:hypothetical protein